MTYEKIVEFVKKNAKAPVKSKRAHTAVEFDIYGEGEGAFYVEIRDGKIAVEPYEYYDRDAKVIITGDELVRIAKGEKTAAESIEDGILMLEGDSEAATELFEAFKTEKKAAAKKATPKKEKAKKAEKKDEKAAAPAEKKETEKTEKKAAKGKAVKKVK